MSQAIIGRDRDADLIPENVRAGIQIDDTIGTLNGVPAGGAVQVGAGGSFIFGYVPTTYSKTYSIESITAEAVYNGNPGPNLSDDKITIDIDGEYLIMSTYETYNETGTFHTYVNGVSIRTLNFSNGYSAHAEDTVTLHAGDIITADAQCISHVGGSDIPATVVVNVGIAFKIDPLPTLSDFATKSAL